MSNNIIGLSVLAASAVLYTTVYQVFNIIQPAVAALQTEQKHTDEDIKYIRDKVDKIYDEVRQE